MLKNTLQYNTLRPYQAPAIAVKIHGFYHFFANGDYKIIKPFRQPRKHWKHFHPQKPKYSVVKNAGDPITLYLSMLKQQKLQ